MKHKEKILQLGTESQGIHTVCLRSIAITAVKQENKEISTKTLRNIPFFVVALSMAQRISQCYFISFVDIPILPTLNLK